MLKVLQASYVEQLSTLCINPYQAQLALAIYNGRECSYPPIVRLETVVVVAAAVVVVVVGSCDINANSQRLAVWQ